MKNPKDESLPLSVRRAAARLREMEPADDFHARLRSALVAADVNPPTMQNSSPPQSWGKVSGGIGLAALAVAALVAVVWQRENDEPQVLHRIHELEVALEDEGHTWLPLTLDTEPHAGARANVHVEAPPGVRVLASQYAEDADEPTCGPASCVHRFDHPTSEENEPHLQIGFDTPGKYRIYVEHASTGQRVRQVFLVAAR